MEFRRVLVRSDEVEVGEVAGGHLAGPQGLQVIAAQRAEAPRGLGGRLADVIVGGAGGIDRYQTAKAGGGEMIAQHNFRAWGAADVTGADGQNLEWHAPSPNILVDARPSTLSSKIGRTSCRGRVGQYV